jgi:uncharacterized Zn-finger protein
MFLQKKNFIMFAVYPLESAAMAASECFQTIRSSNGNRKCRAAVENFECRYCQRSFTKHYNLIIHERTHKNDSYPLSSCDVCGKFFRRVESMKNHRCVAFLC